MYSPKVVIIVLNYNGEDCLLSCLRSLENSAYINKEVIVIDNGSSDNSFVQAKRVFPQFIFIENKKNEGFSRGMNIGLKEALLREAEYCLLFNYDAEIDIQALSILVSIGNKYPSAGLLSPTIYQDRNKNIWFEKGKVLFSRMRAVHIQASLNEKQREAYESDFLTGCSLFIKRELIEKIGFLDEKFFLYYEDVDYSFRARKAGFDLLVVPEAKVYHSEQSKQNPLKTYFLVLSGLLFFQKHTPLFIRPYMAIYVTMRRVKNSIERRFFPTNTSQEVSRAYKDFFHEHATSHFPYFC